MKIQFSDLPSSGRDVLILEDLTIGYKQNVLLSDTNQVLRYGSRTALIGPNGSGKTTLLRTITGAIQPLAGRIQLGANVRIGYMSQDYHKENRTGSALSKQQEKMMLLGAYHSGPLHSIRMTGYVGLLILLLAMIRLAVHAHRQIMRCKGTEWAPVALFFGIPLIAQPFFFTFVFGEYDKGVAATLMGMAMVRLIERNVPLPAYVTRGRRMHVPLALQSRAAEVQSARSV
jgi:energy-coupling factor transporter ATP-binding protein EcfA2